MLTRNKLSMKSMRSAREGKRDKANDGSPLRLAIPRSGDKEEEFTSGAEGQGERGSSPLLITERRHIMGPPDTGHCLHQSDQGVDRTLDAPAV